MKKSETSDSWNELIKELQVKCQEQDVSLLDLVGWIRESIKQIEKITFDYYVASGPSSLYSDQKLDVNILLSNSLQGFTIFQNKKEHSIYPIKIFVCCTEEILGDRIKVTLPYMSGFLLIEDAALNSAKLREFVRKIIIMAWNIE